MTQTERPSGVRTGLPITQDPKLPPVVHSPHLPAMEKVGDVKALVHAAAALPVMGSGAPLHTGGSGVMGEVPQRQAATHALALGPQSPKMTGDTVQAKSYVRLQIHAARGKLSIAGVKEIAGPLALPTTVTRTNAYEVLIDDQQIALGSIPDVGIRRSFANRDVPGPEGKHHIARIPSFDFYARIPREHFTATNMPKMTVVLHQIHEAPDRFAPLVPLRRQNGVLSVEIGRVAGIRLDELPPALRPQFDALLK